MKLAILSDIHGNIYALEAILNDAARDHVDGYLLVGDYCSCFPYPNEVVDVIKALPRATVIHGNEEDVLYEYAKQGQDTWTDGQYQTHYWCYRTIRADNHSYLRKLPKTVTLRVEGTEITAAHSSADLYGDVEYREFSSTKVALKYQNEPDYARQKLLGHMREYLRQNAAFQSAVQALSGGIYVFGHTHVQWHAQSGDNIFINPGSCGLPLDGTHGAPYTLLRIEKSEIQIEERRVPYDLDHLINEYRRSDLFAAAPVWSRVILQEMKTGFEAAHFFLKYAEDYANKIDDPIRPFTVKTWAEAYDHWTKTAPDLLRFS